MQTHLIAVPYDSALRGWRMGAGPERLLDGGLEDELRAAGHQVRIEYIEADSDAPAEIRTAFELNRALAGRVRDAREADALPVVLAGNCMTAVGTLAGLGGTPAVLWFDAHGDFNTPETTPSGFLDGMALAMLTGRCWANLARTVHGFQPVPERDVVLVGARELDAGERVLLDGSEIALLAPEQARTQLAPVLAKLSGREAYVHLDLDALDPAEGRANGLAVPGGFTVDEACAALEQIGHTLRVRAVALTAYDPVCDSEGRICRAASRLLGALLGAVSHPAAQQSLAGDDGRGMPPEELQISRGALRA
ncbi:MAG TPA: arginase family protein [Chloroflexota bacterium]|nr:arginase family protein [Chloroflexota bacterium]